jgi:hypothetical protein
MERCIGPALNRHLLSIQAKPDWEKPGFMRQLKEKKGVTISDSFHGTPSQTGNSILES